MSRGSIYTQKERDTFRAIRKLDDMCISQLQEKALKQEPTPKWLALEIERAFILGMRVALGEIKIPIEDKTLI